jgi:hypothetical protein
MIKLPVYFTRFGSKTDGSASLGFATQELGANDFALLKEHLNEYGWLVFRPNEFKSDDIPKEDAEDPEKTPSKRLRATLYRLWEQNGKQGDSEVYYRTQMEKVINHLKEKLN